MEMENEDFWLFLARVSSEDIKEGMKKEKIGPDLISLMTDEELSKYIPLHGERLRVRKYLRDQTSTKTGGKRSSLLKVLREKIEGRRNQKGTNNVTQEEREDMRESNRRFGNRNAEKDTRKLEIGWIHKTDGKSFQVRSKKGGGTRRLTLRKETNKQTLLEEGKKLFFPNGVSQHGREHEFDFDVWDYQDRSMDEGTTIGDMYKSTKMPVLRFYLASIKTVRDNDNLIHMPDEEPEADDLPELHIPQRRPVNAQLTSSSTDMISEAMQIAGIDTNFDIDDENNYETAANENKDTFTNVDSGNEIDVTPIHVTLHRGQVMKELIEAFKAIEDPLNKIIKPQLIMPNGEMEAAEDAGGVTRDVLTEFWNSFYTECTLGNTHKVPCLRHDFGEMEWTAVGRIITFGWKAVKYFPLHISPAFMQYCIYGKLEEDILDAFMKYIPQSDADILKAALKDVSSVDQAELYDIFTQHELKRVPRQANMERIVREMAHKELIQAAMFVIDCWSPLLKKMRLPENLQSLYENLAPNPRRVIKLLRFPEDMCADATATSNHLKRFIREMDADLLTRFLRFCTGTDLLTEECITVSFVNVVGLARRPVAHTCSSLLELPKQYENFLQFRSEFVSILNANIWVMDII
ncbi:uncharacterized protein LOC117316877 [Pecten maximus]|uniref:uncharacterized protein LOC117316877 n=1 Tax=Pecten maximus TaxID=6579 RepID=UPI0014583F15|nr:uncharacterized protein LOC117316877 [Pecten maximus]